MKSDNIPTYEILGDVLYDWGITPDDVYENYEVINGCYDVEPEDYGYSACACFRRISDNTYWMIDFWRQGDEHSLEESGEKKRQATQVWPVSMVGIRYTTEEPAHD